MANLTKKQERFVEEYLVHRSAAEAYRVAYDASRMRPSSIYVNGHRLLKHAKIAPIIEARLAELGESLSEETEVTIARALQSLIDIVQADPDELTGVRTGACRHCYGIDHFYQWRTEREYSEAVRLAERNDQPLPDMSGGFGYNQTLPPDPNCPECDGIGSEYYAPRDTSKLSAGAKALFAGVKPTRNGPEILLRDKDRAQEAINKIIGAYVERVELSGSTTVAKPDLTGLSASDAASKYAEFVKGVDRGGKKG